MVALITRHMSSTLQCSYCHKSETHAGFSLSRCSRCKIAIYCSAKCQGGAWGAHKSACFAPVDEAEAKGLRVKDIKERLAVLKVDTRGMAEKSELVAALIKAQKGKAA